MNITRNNYEIFFIDYYDGLLSQDKIAELFLFLEKHPDLKAGFEAFSEISLDASAESYPDRESLRRGVVTRENLSWHMIADLEGDLDASSQLKLASYLESHPEQQRDLILYKATRLDPGTEKYPGKEDLKRPVPFTIAYRRAIRYAVAAILLIGLISGVSYLVNRSGYQDEHRVASRDHYPTVVPGIKLQSVTEQPQSPKANTEQAPVSAGTEHRVTGKTKIQVLQPLDLADNHQFPGTIDPIPSIPVHELGTLPDQALVTGMVVSPVADIPKARDDEKYLTVWEAFLKVSIKGVQRLTSQPEQEKPLALAETPSPGLADLVGSEIGKLTNNKVSYSKQNDDTGKKSGFRLAIGKFSVEK